MKQCLAVMALMLITHQAVGTPELERGYQAYESGDVEAAVAIWSVLAYRGDSTAQLNLGQLYRLGTGVEANDREAVKWYSMAAKQGSETAQYNLLMMQEEGRASAADLALAFGGQVKVAPPPIAQSKTKKPAVPAMEGFLIQIIASSNKIAVEEHIQSHLSDILPTTRIVKTRKKDNDWFIAVMGPFETKELAYQARTKLPIEVQKGKPWIRSNASIKELARDS